MRLHRFGNVFFTNLHTLVLNYYYYYYYYYYYLISHFSAVAGKYSPLLGFSNQQD